MFFCKPLHLNFQVEAISACMYADVYWTPVFEKNHVFFCLYQDYCIYWTHQKLLLTIIVADLPKLLKQFNPCYRITGKLTLTGNLIEKTLVTKYFLFLIICMWNTYIVWKKKYTRATYLLWRGFFFQARNESPCCKSVFYFFFRVCASLRKSPDFPLFILRNPSGILPLTSGSCSLIFVKTAA